MAMGRKKYQQRRASAFIFDLDGTLIDSGLDIAKAANFARGHFQLPELPVATIVTYIGDGVVTLLTRCLGSKGETVEDERLAEAVAVFRDYYGRHCLDNTAPYPGVLATLAHFHRLPLMISTNKPRLFTDIILKGLHLDAAFRRVVTPDEVTHRKPDPSGLQACLAGLNVPAPEIVVVGDHPNDIEAARGIGAIAVGASYGLSTPGQIHAAKPDLIIDAFAELQDLFPSRQTA
jgi:phosphoglycolate phosphatase